METDCPKIYIFGVNGYIGRHLAWFARSQNVRVLGMDLDDAGPMDIDYQQFDVTLREGFDRLDFDVDQVFFLAGLTGTEEGFSSYETYTGVNQLGLNHLLDRLVQLKSRARVVFPSTRLVYKGQTAVPLREDAQKKPLTLYALNKLASEQLLGIYANRFGISHTVFRICVPYGNRFDAGYSYGTLGFFLSMASQKKTLTLFGDGSLKRTFTHVEDVCRIMFRAAQISATENRILNIGGEPLSLLDAAGGIARKYGVDIAFTPFPEPAARLETGDTIFDDARLQSLFPYTCRHRFDDWLDRMA